jgi:hypothetical protein
VTLIWGDERVRYPAWEDRVVNVGLSRLETGMS